MSKINRGIWCPRCAAGLWRRGSVLEGRVQVRGGVRRPHALPSRSGARGAAASSSASSSFGPRHSGDVRPGILARQRVRVRQLLPQRTLPGPTRTPACMHGEGDRSPEERRTRHINSGGDEAPFTSGVWPHHTPPDLAVTAPLLSHTPTPREPGEGRRLRDGGVLIIRGEAVTVPHIYIINTYTPPNTNIIPHLYIDSIYIHTHTHTHTYISTYIHTHTHIYIYI